VIHIHCVCTNLNELHIPLTSCLVPNPHVFGLISDTEGTSDTNPFRISNSFLVAFSDDVLPVLPIPDLLPAPVHHRCTSSQSALIRCIYDDSDITSPSIMTKPASIPVSTLLPLSGLHRYRHSELTPTMSVHYNNSDTCLRNQFRNYCYVVKIIPVLLKNISHFATKLYKYFMFVSLRYIQGSRNVTEWVIYSKISFTHSPSWYAHHISLHLSRNLYLRHDFSVRKMKFLFKSDSDERLRHSKNLMLLVLRILRHTGYCIRWARKRFRIRTRRCMPNLKPKSWAHLQRQENLNCSPKSNSSEQKPGEAPKHMGDIGGHQGRVFAFDVIEPYLTADAPTRSSHSQYSFVDHVNDTASLQYPKDQYVHAQMPLNILVTSLNLASARKIAAIHGITAGSRCKLAELQIRVAGHTCLACTTYVSIFLEEHNRAHAAMERSRTNRIKRKACNVKNDVQVTPVEFPPLPLDSQLGYKIIASACKRMSKTSLEEAGCAVCGELKPLNTMSKLKSVKNLLHILATPGVTRRERKDNTSKIQEFTGPVLDHTCDKICDQCHKAIRENKIPRLALAQNLWIGTVPEELKCLRFVEKILIARVRHTCSFVKVASGMRKMKANVVAFESPIPKIYEILPPPREDLDDVLAILFTGPCKPSEADLTRIPFLVRRNRVMRALQWLKANHCDYANIEISTQNLESYSETEPPVSIQYQQSNTNKSPEGTSVFDNDIEDGTEEGDCSFTVHGLTGENLDTMTISAIKAQALHHLNNRGKFLLVGQSKKLESIWNNAQLYPQMFPWLFPYGLGRIGTTKLSDKEHKRHLLMYHDKRFQVDINFPFVAFSHEQTKASTTQSFLLVDQNRFGSITDRLLNLDQAVLTTIIEKMAQGEHIKPESNAEKACFQIIKDLDHVAGKVNGSTTSKKYMRNEIWSLIAKVHLISM